jgi:hypothetical protein
MRVSQLLLIIICLGIGAPALAIYSNYNSILIGDQASGMGSAYAAMSGDVPASSFYNPAGLAWLSQQSVSASVGIYKKFDTHFGDYEDFTKASLRVNQGFFRSIPSSSGSLIRLKDIAPNYNFAFSIVVPDYENFKGDIQNNQTNNSALSFVDESLWVGVSASKKVSKRESYGLSLFYTARNYVRTISDRTFNSGSDSTIYNEDKAFVQNAIVPIFGYQKILAPKWRLGASLRLSSYHVSGTGSFFRSIISTSNSSILVDPMNSNEIRSKGPIPPRLTMGLSFYEADKFTVAADLNIYGKLRYFDLDEESIATLVDQRLTWNGSLGIEVQMRRWLKGRIGWFTNLSPFRDPDLSSNQDVVRKVDQLGWAANVALSQGPITYTFGGYYTGGRGKSLQRVNQQFEVVPVTTQVFTMLVGTAYSY